MATKADGEANLLCVSEWKQMAWSHQKHMWSSRHSCLRLVSKCFFFGLLSIRCEKVVLLIQNLLQLIQDSEQHSVSYTLNRSHAVIVQYDKVPDMDMFQIGRSSEPPIDFVVMDTVAGNQRASRSGVTQSTISRFACRITIDRKPPHTARIFAAGFDSGRNIFLGVSFHPAMVKSLLRAVFDVVLCAGKSDEMADWERDGRTDHQRSVDHASTKDVRRLIARCQCLARSFRGWRHLCSSRIAIGATEKQFGMLTLFVEVLLWNFW